MHYFFRTQLILLFFCLC